MTTIPVFCEIHAFFSRNPGRRKTVLVDFWKNPLVEFEPVSHEDCESAVEFMSLQIDKDYSFCDVLSSVVMKRLEITRVATFDQHFRQFGGFEIVI